MTTAIMHSLTTLADVVDVEPAGALIYRDDVRAGSVGAGLVCTETATAKIAKRLPGVTTTVHVAPHPEPLPWCNAHRRFGKITGCGSGPSDANPHTSRCAVTMEAAVRVDIRAEGLPMFDGDWAVAGVLTRDQAGTIVATSVGVHHDDEMFARDHIELMGECRHCNLTRNRSVTILLTDGVEVRPVGRSCLTEYTGGAIRVEILAVLIGLAERFATEFGGAMEAYGDTAPTVEVLALAIAYVRAFGFVKADEWQKTPTAVEVRGALTWDGQNGRAPAIMASSLTDADKAHAARVIAELCDTTGDDDRDMESSYLADLRAVLANPYIQYIGKRNRVGLLASAPTAWERKMSRRAQAPKASNPSRVNAPIGYAGEKRDFVGKVVTARVIDTDWGVADMLVIDTDEGTVKVFGKFPAAREMEPGQTVRILATIKGHRLYQDHMQTLVIRAKLG